MKPIKIKHLPAFLAAIEPIAKELAAGDILGALAKKELAAGDILGALAKQADNLITATALGANVERAWLDEQTPDVFIDLASQVIEVNADFFAQHVLPALTAATKRLAGETGGTTGLADSLSQDSTTAV